MVRRARFRHRSRSRKSAGYGVLRYFRKIPPVLSSNTGLGIQAAMQAFQRYLLIGTAFLVKQPVSSIVFDKEIEVPDDIRSVPLSIFCRDFRCV